MKEMNCYSYLPGPTAKGEGMMEDGGEDDGEEGCHTRTATTTAQRDPMRAKFFFTR